MSISERRDASAGAASAASGASALTQMEWAAMERAWSVEDELGLSIKKTSVKQGSFIPLRDLREQYHAISWVIKEPR